MKHTYKFVVFVHHAVHIVNLRGILSSPIPRIYDAGPDGPLPVDNDCQLLGQVAFCLFPAAVIMVGGEGTNTDTGLRPDRLL